MLLLVIVIFLKDKGLNVIRVYKFWGLSDKNDSRNFTKMIKDIKRRKKTIAIVCDSADKLAKYAKDFFKLEDLRENELIEYHFSSENEVYGFYLKVRQFCYLYFKAFGRSKRNEENI